MVPPIVTTGSEPVGRVTLCTSLAKTRSAILHFVFVQRSYPSLFAINIENVFEKKNTRKHERKSLVTAEEQGGHSRE